jgi:RNA polymerase sigma factor (sigma-70 family)
MSRTAYFISLFESHYADLRAQIAYRFKKQHQDVDDILQDAFHNILRSDNIEHLENPKAYLYQAASNLALNRIRKQKHHQNYLMSQDFDRVEEVSPEQIVISRRALADVCESLETFPEKYRRTFLLSRVEGKTYKEISVELNIAESTVEKHIIKTLKFLRDRLQEVES